jgi:hypothetical protein
MNKYCYKFFLIALLSACSIIYALTELQYFTGKNESDSILLEWKTGFENNLNRFEVERSVSEPNNFIYIGSLNAIGNNSYYYYRDNVTMQSSGTVYYYRLKLVDNNGGHAYSHTITVTHVISSVRDTWGSIKAIFR